MKKFFLLVAFALLLFSPLVFAVEFTLDSSYKQGETIITKISGNFITSLTKSNVFFYKEHTRVPMDFGLVKVEKEYYLYVSLTGKAPGNYSISLENIQYMQGAETLSDDIIRNFSITSETADFSLKPGAISTSGDFSVEIQNLKDSQLAISVRTQVVNASERAISIISHGANVDSLSFSLVSGEIKKIYFTSGYGISNLQKIELKSSNMTYEAPVYIYQDSLISTVSYDMEPKEIIYSLPTNTVTKKSVFLYNTGDKEITNISFSLSDEIKPFVNLSQEYIEVLPAKTNFPVGLSFFSPGEIEIAGTLKANINGREVLYTQISLKFLSDYVPTNDTQQSSSVRTCEELQGKVCGTTEACDSEILYAKGGVICCMGSCVSTKKKSSTGVIIFLSILAVLAVVGFWFYQKKFKKAKKPVNLLDIAKGK